MCSCTFYIFRKEQETRRVIEPDEGRGHYPIKGFGALCDITNGRFPELTEVKDGFGLIFGGLFLDHF